MTRNPRPLRAAAPVRVAALLGLAVIVTGCSPSATPARASRAGATSGASTPADAPGQGAPGPQQPAGQQPAGQQPAGQVAGSTPAATVPRGQSAVVLAGTGLGILAPDAAVSSLSFTTAVAQVQPAVEAVLGQLTPVDLPGCPQGPRVALELDGFRLLTDGQRWTGWTDEGSATRTLSTGDGIGVGSPLSDLQSAQPDVVVVPGPDSATFSTAEGLSGELDGTEPGSQVLQLTGGEGCQLP